MERSLSEQNFRNKRPPFSSLASPVQGGEPRMLRIATVWQLALGKMKEVSNMLASPVQGVNKCFLANLEMPHCSGHFPTEARALPRETVDCRRQDGRVVVRG